MDSVSSLYNTLLIDQTFITHSLTHIVTVLYKTNKPQ